MTKYQCGHETDIIIIAESALSLTAYIEWAQTVGRDGDKTQCWACWCKGGQPWHEKLEGKLSTMKYELESRDRELKRLRDGIRLLHYGPPRTQLNDDIDYYKPDNDGGEPQ